MKRSKDIIKHTTKTLTVKLHVDIIEEDGCYIAYCPALELSSYGKDEETAQKRFVEVVEIFFNETRRKGTLEKYLLKMGWTLKKKPIPEYTPPANITYPHKIHHSFIENVAIPVS